jgi:hypothetical protein
VAAGVEDQRDGEQSGGDDDPQQQNGLLPAQARVQAARLREGYALAPVPPGAAPTWDASRPRRIRIFSRTGISSPAASRLKMFSMEAGLGSEPARLSSMEPRACLSGSLMLIIKSEAGA